MTGRIHSFQSLGTLDGPGLRCVVFMQGCPLRCVCCHNPDTWEPFGGKETETDELTAKILRFRGYFGIKGGVTVSGGEPLLQAEFVSQLFQKLKKLGVHTALDTSGCIWNGQIEELLRYTDLVILDHKYPDSQSYLKYTGCSMEHVEFFLGELERRHVPTWLRRVVIPGLNDSEGSAYQLRDTAKRFLCVEKAEFLPFRKLCIEKYRALGIPFPLEDTPEPSDELMSRLGCIIK